MVYLRVVAYHAKYIDVIHALGISRNVTLALKQYTITTLDLANWLAIFVSALLVVLIAIKTIQKIVIVVKKDILWIMGIKYVKNVS